METVKYSSAQIEKRATPRYWLRRNCMKFGYTKIFTYKKLLYATQILSSKQLVKVNMPPRYWFRRNW